MSSVESLARRRRRSDLVMRLAGRGITYLVFFLLFYILFTILVNGRSALVVHRVKLPIVLNCTEIKNADLLTKRDLYNASLKLGLAEVLGYEPRILGIATYAKLEKYFASSSCYPRQEVWLPLVTKFDLAIKNSTYDPEYKKIYQTLKAAGRIKLSFNSTIFLGSDSRSAEDAGILGSLLGSVMCIIVCLLMIVPIGVMTAICLTEFMPKNKFTGFIRVSIKNLAAIPSIIFGILGLAIYIGVLGVPRSSSLVGGMTLSLMMLPNVVIYSIYALENVPIAIKEAAFALGASKIKTILHHVLPLSWPGIVTGTLLGIARVLGESSPLLIIGMMAFIVKGPTNFLDPATVLPVQIYMWTTSTEEGFGEITAVAIVFLLALVLLLNAIAHYVRKKFEIHYQ